ncbi:hypothetical protein ACOIXW_004971, partial [Vibrio parahaemolyticus]
FRRIMNPWVRFENVEVKRDGYYVSYSPKFVSAANDDSTALLSVRLLRDTALKNVNKLQSLNLNIGSSAIQFHYKHWLSLNAKRHIVFQT